MLLIQSDSRYIAIDPLNTIYRELVKLAQETRRIRPGSDDPIKLGGSAQARMIRPSSENSIKLGGSARDSPSKVRDSAIAARGACLAADHLIKLGEPDQARRIRSRILRAGRESPREILRAGRESPREILGARGQPPGGILRTAIAALGTRASAFGSAPRMHPHHTDARIRIRSRHPRGAACCPGARPAIHRAGAVVPRARVASA